MMQTTERRTSTEMDSTSDKYTYRVTWSDEDAEYVGLCAEFPSLSWLAKTKEEALRGIGALVVETVADLHGRGETVPQPIAMREYSGTFKVRIPAALHRRLVMEALEYSVSLNRLVNMKLANTEDLARTFASKTARKSVLVRPRQQKRRSA
jgi:predicted HicB family RNase H-like nuclease